MSHYASLLEIAKLLLHETETSSVAAAVLQKLVEIASAERGFVVVREGDGFEVKHDVRFARDGMAKEERRVSRKLVRHVIETRAPFVSSDVLADPRLERLESIESAGARAVLVAPLSAGDEIYGVIYLDRPTAQGGFGPDVERLVADVSALGGLSLKLAIEREEVTRRVRSLERDLSAKHDFQGIVTRDERMHGLLRLVAQVATSDAMALVSGETGTGKELIARALHANSARAARPFVTLHCAALPASLLESELFGHVRGAFTGADRDRSGRVAAASRGTLFLDEVGEIPLEIQAKLLRFLQFGEVQRVGSDRVEKVDVRVVAATHRPLRAMVEAGTFRQDLYYRLNVVELRLPPLRDRRGDIPLLVDAFLREAEKGARGKHRFTPAAMKLLVAHDYPGNVRELKHIVERARVLAASPEMGVDLLPPELVPVATEGGAEDGASVPTSLAKIRESAVNAAEEAYLRDLLDRAAGNISQAARDSGIHRSYLQRLLTKHKIRSG